MAEFGWITSHTRWNNWIRYDEIELFLPDSSMKLISHVVPHFCYPFFWPTCPPVPLLRFVVPWGVSPGWAEVASPLCWSLGSRWPWPFWIRMTSLWSFSWPSYPKSWLHLVGWFVGCLPPTMLSMWGNNTSITQGGCNSTKSIINFGSVAATSLADVIQHRRWLDRRFYCVDGTFSFINIPCKLRRHMDSIRRGSIVGRPININQTVEHSGTIRDAGGICPLVWWKSRVDQCHWWISLTGGKKKKKTSNPGRWIPIYIH